MKTGEVVSAWFDKWEGEDFINLPFTVEFEHTSLFGTISGKQTYLELVKNIEINTLIKPLRSTILFLGSAACVPYSASQGKDFKLEVSEWYYFIGDRIDKITSYYDIRE